MLEWVEKLTISPAMCTQADVEILRQVGWTDRDILDIAQVCAYFNLRVRIVDGLGLELGEWQTNRSWSAAGRPFGRRSRRRYADGPLGSALKPILPILITHPQIGAPVSVGDYRTWTNCKNGAFISPQIFKIYCPRELHTHN